MPGADKLNSMMTSGGVDAGGEEGDAVGEGQAGGSCRGVAGSRRRRVRL